MIYYDIANEIQGGVIAKMKNKIIELSVMAVFIIVISRKFDDIDKKLMQIKESYNITGKKLTY
jgi:hypothetical protein